MKRSLLSPATPVAMPIPQKLTALKLIVSDLALCSIFTRQASHMKSSCWFALPPTFETVSVAVSLAVDSQSFFTVMRLTDNFTCWYYYSSATTCALHSSSFPFSFAICLSLVAISSFCFFTLFFRSIISTAVLSKRPSRLSIFLASFSICSFRV